MSTILVDVTLTFIPSYLVNSRTFSNPEIKVIMF